MIWVGDFFGDLLEDGKAKKGLRAGRNAPVAKLYSTFGK